MTRRTVVLAGIAAALIAAACGGSGSAGDQEASPGGGGAGPVEAARRSLTALVAGDEPAFLETVRPDERAALSTERLMSGAGGCDPDGADVIDEQRASFNVRLVTFVFEDPCGEGELGASTVRCTLFITELGGRWWVERPWLQCDGE